MLTPDTIRTNFTPNMYAYNLSFAGQEYNYSAAIAIVMGILTVIIAAAVQSTEEAGRVTAASPRCRRSARRTPPRASRRGWRGAGRGAGGTRCC